ncbi:MAG: hypothetical protein ACK44L_12290 [Burkholderiales bacterium]|jgi:hypothetical protein
MNSSISLDQDAVFGELPLSGMTSIPSVSPELAAGMQDEILSAGTELERLQKLLGDAVVQLQQRFGVAMDLQRGLPEGPGREALGSELHAALVALQFEDLASQLISHSRRRLASVADCLGNLAVADDEPGAEVNWVARACPVAQRAVDAGSVELF